MRMMNTNLYGIFSGMKCSALKSFCIVNFDDQITYKWFASDMIHTIISMGL